MGRTTGLWRFRPAETRVDEEIGMPKAITITGNSPNPFNPSTTISFSLPAPGHASLAVYDITGRKVRTLVSGLMSSGEHAVTWDGRDEAGQPVASGVYISRLTAGKHVATEKMALVR